ncbi:hypothetical protein [Cupriavidus sp. WS]|uniref:hypothetical protein n=1 Tax=Cupriavidus sp. WS TaxID=1312922 RepID=UPI0003633570|nr:hypothetical protein [Cupriavidus sp. WS]
MLDFSTLTVEAAGGYVGLERRQGRAVLRLPYHLSHLEREPVRALAMLYKVLGVFRTTDKAAGRLAPVDGIEHNGASARGTRDEGVSFHDTLGLEALFQAFDPLGLLSLVERRGRTSRVDYGKLHRHLHRAVYLDDGAPFVEYASGPRRELRLAAHDLVGLYCFVAGDFYTGFLGLAPEQAWGDFSGEALAQAADFRHRFLHADSGLFGGDAFVATDTRERLREILFRIERQTPFKSQVFLTLFDGLRRYLEQGWLADRDDGMVWGIGDFWSVWESACLAHALARHAPGDIFTCDYQHLPAALLTREREQAWQASREAVFARNEYRRRPDLVVRRDGGYRIADFKYYAELAARRPKPDGAASAKQVADFDNIELYGLLLRDHLHRTGQPGAARVALEFWLPAAARHERAFTRAPAWSPPLRVVGQPVAALLDDYAKLFRVQPARR